MPQTVELQVSKGSKEQMQEGQDNNKNRGWNVIWAEKDKKNNETVVLPKVIKNTSNNIPHVTKKDMIKLSFYCTSSWYIESLVKVKV